MSDILAEPLSIAINKSISTSAFPNNAKIASVVLTDKKTDDQYVISNFRPVNILKETHNSYICIFVSSNVVIKCSQVSSSNTNVNCASNVSAKNDSYPLKPSVKRKTNRTGKPNLLIVGDSHIKRNALKKIL